MTVETDWSKLRGMTCTCPPGCTTGDIWCDGPRQCDPACQPCTIMRGTPYTKQKKAKPKPRKVAA